MSYSTIFSIATITGVEQLNDGLYALFPLVYFSETTSTAENAASQQVENPENENSTDEADKATSNQQENTIEDVENVYSLRDRTSAASFGSEEVVSLENPHFPNGEINPTYLGNQSEGLSTEVSDDDSSSMSENIIDITYKNFINILRIWKQGEKVKLQEIKAYFESENLKVSMNHIRRLLYIALKKKSMKMYGKKGNRIYKIV